MSYYGAIQYILNARAKLEEGYVKVSHIYDIVNCGRPIHYFLQYKKQTFKIPRLLRWEVIVNTPELVEEVGKARAEILSSHDALEEVRTLMRLPLLKY